MTPSILTLQLPKKTPQKCRLPHLPAGIINKKRILPTAEDRVFSKKYPLPIAEDSSFLKIGLLLITEGLGFIQNYCLLIAEDIVFKQKCRLLIAEGITFKQKWLLPQLLKALLLLGYRLFGVGFSPQLAKNPSGTLEIHFINLPGTVPKWNTPGFKN